MQEMLAMLMRCVLMCVMEDGMLEKRQGFNDRCKQIQRGHQGRQVTY